MKPAVQYQYEVVWLGWMPGGRVEIPIAITCTDTLPELGEFSGLVDELEERAARMARGKLYLVDLAASESFDTVNEGMAKAAPSGDHFGLLALGKVLTALAGGRTHVPYREATLTKLLQQALP